MTLDWTEIKDQLRARWQLISERVSESAFYQRARDTYEALSPRQQRYVNVGAGVLGFLLLFSIPLADFGGALSWEGIFNERRSLIERLFQVTTQVKQVPANLTTGEAERLIVSALNRQNLLPEQKKGARALAVTDYFETSKKAWVGGVRVEMASLNLEQVLRLGRVVENAHRSLRMLNLSVEQSKDKPSYWDVVYHLGVIHYPKIELPDPNKASKEAGKSLRKKPTRSRSNSRKLRPRSRNSGRSRDR